MDLIVDRSYRAAADVTRLHAKSFYFASVALPHDKKRHAYALYSFCRYLDDRVDRADSPAAMDEAVRELEDFVARVASGSGTITGERRRLPWVDAFLHTTEVCGIPADLYRDLLHGVRLDRAEVELPDWPSLKSYCYYVAGVVGLMMTRIFGMEDRTHDPRAVELGEAMQLTNILRDVAEDLRLGRVYLPKEELARFGLDRAFLARGQVTPEWREFMRFQTGRARAAYASAEPGIRALPRDGSQRTVWLMSTIYAGILDAVEEADYDVFTARRHVPLSRKCLLAMRVWFR
ncbi:MAG: phytoene/squalene synthase family protein [Candidatus Methylacidiphilales bacterium]|nr:phytoene/squalene synthase family protein [Candidatus Methylacidiphilales bacterium]